MSEELISCDQPIQRSTEKRWPVTLLGLGTLLLTIELGILEAHLNKRFYGLLFWLLISGIPFVLAVWWTFRRKKFPANTFLIILIGGTLFRLILVPLDPPRLSTDIYRYIWDDMSKEPASTRTSTCRSILGSRGCVTVPSIPTLTVKNMRVRFTRLSRKFSFSW